MKYRVGEVEGKGKALMATERISKGEVLFVEEAIFNASKSSRGNLGTGGNVNQDEYDIDFLDRQVAQLSQDDLALFLDLNDPNPEGPLCDKNKRIYINNTYHEGIFLCASRINHSCLPNVMLSSDNGHSIEVVALRDIDQDEEILVSYLRTSSLETRQEREAKLKELWGFHCDCSLCSMTSEEAEDNDRKRKDARYIIDRINKLFDSFWKVDCRVSGAVAGPLIQSFQCQAEETLKVLETDLEGQADTATLAILLQLAELAAFASSARFGGDLKLSEDSSSPSYYVERARLLAVRLGPMFQTNCSTTEREIRELVEQFG